MTDRPILFSAPMVRALLEGRKTQTRRVLKPQPEPFRLKDGAFCDVYLMQIEGDEYPRIALGDGRCGVITEQEVRCTVGDRLWVRETFTVTQHGKAVYRADARDQGGARWSSIVPGDPDHEVRWRSPIHMPRWASRLTLVVTDVRVQRLHDISEDDAMAEGVETDVWDMAPVGRRYGTDDGWFVGWSMGIHEPSVSVEWDEVCRKSYASLWNYLNGPGSWEANPFIAAYSFTVHHCNIDAMPAPTAAAAE